MARQDSRRIAFAGNRRVLRPSSSPISRRLGLPINPMSIVHLIRQLVRVACGVEWKMRGQPLAYCCDSPDQAFIEITFPKLLRDDLYNVGPNSWPTFAWMPLSPNTTNLWRAGTTKNNTALCSLVAVMRIRTNACSAAFRTSPQNRGDTETRISPDVCFSALRIASLIRSLSMVRSSLLHVITMIRSRLHRRTVHPLRQIRLRHIRLPGPALCRRTRCWPGRKRPLTDS